MTKTKVLRIYTLLSIVVGFVLFFYSLTYVGNYTNIILSFNQIAGEFYGSVDKTLMNVTLSIYGDELVVFNVISIVTAIVLVLNIVFAIVIGKTDTVESKWLKDVFQINILVSLIVFLGTLLFIFLIPEKINGEIISYFLYVKMPILNSESVYIVNLMYLGSTFYVVYNFIVFFKTLPVSVSEVDEELYAEEFYSHLESQETNEEDDDDLDK